MPGGSFGEGKGPIAWGNVACTGTEATIQQCPRAAANKVDCERPHIGPALCHVCGCPLRPHLPKAPLQLAAVQARTERMWVSFAATQTHVSSLPVREHVVAAQRSQAQGLASGQPTGV